jgi:hypothetical protein
MAEKFARAMSSVLTDQTREVILTIKSELSKRPGFPKVRGITIYRAVLESGVQSVADFLNWQKNYEVPEIETFCPSK